MRTIKSDRIGLDHVGRKLNVEAGGLVYRLSPEDRLYASHLAIEHSVISAVLVLLVLVFFGVVL